MVMDTGKLTIRRAQAGDGRALASLAGQLGYPTRGSDAERQWSLLTREEGHAVFVAELEGYGIVGWSHLMPRQLLYVPRLAEIAGLVVDAEHRRRGVGRALIHATEQWAKGQGYSTLVVRSNAARKEAHTFYPVLGYCHVKTQMVYGKELKGQKRAAGPCSKLRA